MASTENNEWKVGQIVYRVNSRGWCEEFEVLRATPKGYWISRYRALVEGNRSDLALLAASIDRINEMEKHKKWVSKKTYFVSSTKTDALGHAIARAHAYHWHCNRRLNEAVKRIQLLENMSKWPHDSIKSSFQLLG